VSFGQAEAIHAAEGLDLDAVRPCTAILRARKRLYLSRVVNRSRFGKPYKTVPSRFWNEMQGLTEVPTARDVEPLLPSVAR